MVGNIVVGESVGFRVGTKDDAVVGEPVEGNMEGAMVGKGILEVMVEGIVEFDNCILSGNSRLSHIEKICLL